MVLVLFAALLVLVRCGLLGVLCAGVFISFWLGWVIVGGLPAQVYGPMEVVVRTCLL